MVKGGRITNSESRVRAALCSSAWLILHAPFIKDSGIDVMLAHAISR